MIILPLLVVQVNAFAIFDACAKTHANLRAASVVVSVKGKSSSRYEISFIQPNRARIRLSSIAAGGTAASERAFTLVGAKVYGVDLKTNEWLERSAGTTGTIAYRLSSVIGQLDDPATFLLIPDRAKEYLALFKSMPRWIVNRNSAEITVHTTVPGTGEYSFKFDAKDKRMLSANLLTNGQVRTTWSYSYKTPPTSITWNPPVKSRKVFEFRDRARPPVFRSKSARAIYDIAFAAYRRLPNLNYRVTDDTQTFDVKFTRTSATQKSKLYSFAYANGTLTIGKKSFKCNSSDIGVHLQKAKIGIEPVLRSLIYRENPVEHLLSQGLTVSVAGNMKIDGVMNDLLEGKTKDYRITVAIRRDNHLITTTTSENYDGKGRRVSRTERRFTYR